MTLSLSRRPMRSDSTGNILFDATTSHSFCGLLRGKIQDEVHMMQLRQVGSRSGKLVQANPIWRAILRINCREVRKADNRHQSDRENVGEGLHGDLYPPQPRL